MRHNWDLKSFTDVATTITPISKIEKSEYMKTGLYPIISQEDSLISGYWNNPNDLTPHPSPVVIFGDHTRILKYVDFEFAVGADGVKIIQPKDNLNAKFLYHYLHWLNIPSLGYSRHFKLIKEAKFSVPPLKVQEQIVVELDKITEIINDCKEAIRNLNSLTQSLFYDFFGDPLTNPKGWEVKPMQSIMKLHSGNALASANIVKGSYPVYGGNGIVGYHKSSNLSGDNIIIGRVGALCGNVRLVRGDIYVTDNAFVSSFFIPINLTFIVHLLTMLNLRKYAKAAAQPVISNSSLKDILIILPPLSLQEKFEDRIERIEQQKKGLEETIANMQMLLNSRMDYWFN